MPKQVDIIIPVYRGISETVACIDSVFASQTKNKTGFNVIVIDDCSPEVALSEELTVLSEKYGFTHLINEANLGFVKTVNRGMTQTDNDVVLLNSDTEVVNNWLDRLVYHATNTDDIASVTPFSNNATICSYPVFCAKNPIVINESIESLDYYFHKANDQESLEIPTAVGFCMYIPRRALDKIGLFDEESFGKGYGEENDFCCRAKKQGFRNIIALDTFVMHEGGVSFADMQETFQASGSKALNQKHPEYDGWVQEFVAADPLMTHRRKVDLLRIRHSKKPTILLVLHELGGGTSKHVQDLAELFHGKANILAIQPEKAYLKLFLAVESEDFELFFLKSQPKKLLDCLKLLNIDRIHYHHVLGIPDMLLTVSEDLNVSYDITLHDYYFSCLNIHLNNTVGLYCGEPILGGDDHDCACLKEAGRQQEHIKKWQPFLEKAARIFAPSHDLKQRFLNYYPSIDTIYAPHYDKEEFYSAVTDDLLTSQKTRVMLIGALSQLKGADIIEAVIQKARKYPKLDFHLIGFTYTGLKTSKNIKVYGAYQEKDLPSLIVDISPDLFWFVSLVPESYSYTLSHAMATNKPIVATDIGAIAERLSTYPKAWIFPYQTTVNDWLEFFVNYKEKPYHQIKTTDYDKVWLYSENYLLETSKTELIFTNSILPYAVNCRQKQSLNLRDPKLLLVNLLLYIRKNKQIRVIMSKIPLKQQIKVKNWLLGNRK